MLVSARPMMRTTFFMKTGKSLKEGFASDTSLYDYIVLHLKNTLDPI